MTRCEFAYDDGAYVLGALAPAERAAYERHLSGCASCRESVAEIAVLPGLLGRLDPAGLEQILPPPAPPRVPALLDEARRRRRRQRSADRRRYALTTLAAAGLALVVGVGTAAVLPRPVAPPPGAQSTPGPQVSMVAMRPVAQAGPVHADIGLVGTKWGTRVTMRCGYDARTSYGKAYPFRLVARGPNGATEQIGSWLAAPGDDLSFTGATRFTDAELTSVELQKADGTPLLTYAVP
ncbi:MULTISPECIES: zf-HC2 domain-containing protein [unclassified Micromonospora]|uniref:anti-sigma factor family protein n=1 Tax=unclassified Micromonospora TaxID=2617518 RepID=UPI002499B332|nr:MULTISPECIES: zf-HC2 domain-containing protein [unclassified Micromonospora]WFE50679.1 zf-HC2 domain-containing protein [Micromonospora sp. WMMD1155]WFF02484.1 zf-HC2 domain-containing protein [Micromonospora sp. WMMD964]